MKRENTLLLIVIAVILTTAGFWYWNNKTGIFENKPQPAGIILFYGDTCLHCKNVDDFIEENKVEDKVEFTKLEVFDNADNQKIFAQKATICQIPEKDWGVPLLWDGQSCIVGDQDIINFFQDKINTTVK